MDEIIMAELNRIHDEDKRQNERLEKLEQITESVHELAFNMQRMLEEMKNHNARLEKIENAPIDSLKSAKITIVNTLIGVIVGALAVGLVQLIASNVR